MVRAERSNGARLMTASKATLVIGKVGPFRHRRHEREDLRRVSVYDWDKEHRLSGSLW